MFWYLQLARKQSVLRQKKGSKLTLQNGSCENLKEGAATQLCDLIFSLAHNYSSKGKKEPICN